MEHFCCIVVLSCYSLCVVLSMSCYDQFHVNCINLGLMKCENICTYVCACACVRTRSSMDWIFNTVDGLPASLFSS
jgi:hypothetical protein